jgi:hypothetical protein
MLKSISFYKKNHNNLIPSIFVNWDNSPRKSHNDSYIWDLSTKELFHFYFKSTFTLANKFKTDFLFINAWNEWAEGAYLEPDVNNSYTYLQVIKDTIKEAKS